MSDDDLDDQLNGWLNLPSHGSIDWLPRWKRTLMLGWTTEDGSEEILGASSEIQKLHKLGVSILPLLTALTQTRVNIGYAKDIRQLVASRNRRWDDAEKLAHGSREENWEVIERWAPVLRRYTPPIRITFFEAVATEKADLYYVIQKQDRRSKHFPPKPIPPPGTKPIREIRTQAYPNRVVLKQLGKTIPDREVLNWIANRIMRMGHGSRHRHSETDVQQCAMTLRKLVMDEIGQPRNHELGVLLAAAFPEFFNPRHDPGNAMMKLLARARQSKSKVKLKRKQTQEKP